MSLSQIMLVPLISDYLVTVIISLKSGMSCFDDEVAEFQQIIFPFATSIPRTI